MITPPPGYRFDPFADIRLGRSLFQMEPSDWLVSDRDGSGAAGQTAKRAGPKATARAEGIAQPLPPESSK